MLSRKPKKPLSNDEALARCAELCNRCEQCTPDLHSKMHRWGLSFEDTTKIVEQLEDLGYVDDRRFVRAYAHDKVCFSGWGRYKIERALRAKFIDRDIVDLAMEGVEDEEYLAAACKATAAKLRQFRPEYPEYEKHMKVLAHVMQRGFEIPVAKKALREVLAQLEEDDLGGDYV